MTKPPKKNRSRLAAALKYGAEKLHVAPVYGVNGGRCNCGNDDCTQTGTHLRTPGGIDDATSKPAEIEAFKSWSSSRIAIATGVDGVVALRVTGKKPQAALAEFLSSAATVQVIDGSARIYLWRAPDGTVPEGRVLLRKGVEVLGRGAYFIAPNDLNTTQGTRRFADGGVIGKTDIAAAPDWLLARLRPHVLGIDAKPPSPGAQKVRFKTVTVDINCIIDGNDPCDPEQVKRRVQSISETGPRMPPAVRLDGGFRDNLPLYRVLTGRCQIEALKLLGATHVDCILVDADEDGADVWRIAELFDEPQKTVLERAELAMQCVRIVRQKVGHIARPRGGRQANDRGLGTAERILGVSRRDLGRFEKIAGISAEAKEETRRAGLDDNQNALLAIAQVSAEKQVRKVRELSEPYAGGRRKPSPPAKSKKAARSSGAAATKKKLVDTKEGPDEADTDAAPPTDATDDVNGSADVSEVGAESPPLVPQGDGLGLPPILRRTNVEKQYEDFEARWEQYCGAAFAALPAAMQSKFASELLGQAVIAAGKGEGSR